MHIMIIGASQGLGRAFTEGLPRSGDHVTGVSRTRPASLSLPAGVSLDWLEADMADPTAPALLARKAPDRLDALIYNLGVWEDTAFTDAYDFAGNDDAMLARMIQTNVTAALLLFKHLVPRLLHSPRPRLILTGSTSGLPRSGRPEVAFGASKFALAGMADALRESYREQGLAVTCLQLGYLNTDDDLACPREQAARRGHGELVPMHDVVHMTRAILDLSDASFVRELVLPALRDARF